MSSFVNLFETKARLAHNATQHTLVKFLTPRLAAAAAHAVLLRVINAATRRKSERKWQIKSSCRSDYIECIGEADLAPHTVAQHCKAWHVWTQFCYKRGVWSDTQKVGPTNRHQFWTLSICSINTDILLSRTKAL